MHRYVLADVFTDVMFGGNQLAVFPDTRDLSDAVMQKIARELNLSETVFVHQPDDPENDFKLRIFTPAFELPFAGHPTVGAACVLAHLGMIQMAGDEATAILEENIGPVTVKVRRAGEHYAAEFTAARLPEAGPPVPPLEVLAEILGLPPAAVQAAEAVSAGVPFVFVSVRDRDALQRIRFNTAAWEAHLASFWAPHVYVLTLDRLGEGVVRARMFAPSMGIVEDPATGAAAVALGDYLAARDSRDSGTLSWVIEQGIEMGRPSRIEVSADKRNGKVTAVRVGGTSVVVGEGELRLIGGPI